MCASCEITVKNCFCHSEYRGFIGIDSDTYTTTSKKYNFWWQIWKNKPAQTITMCVFPKSIILLLLHMVKNS